MNKLDPKEIVRNAIDGLTYSKAYDLFSRKKVVLNWHRNELDQDVYDGVVTGKSNRSYPVSAVIDTEGKVVSASCGCDYYMTYPGYCKHILALLLQINELTNKKGTDVLTSLLQYYKKSVSLNISLTPVFYSYKYETGIEFKIGKEGKKYFVKNIPEMYDNIANNYYFKYGKDLEFMHTMSAFDAESRTILEDLSDYLNFYSPNSKGYFDGKRKCKIPKIVFKKVLDMFIDRPIEFVFDEAHFEVIYSSGAPKIELIFEADTLSIKDVKNMKLFSVGRNHYVLQDEKLFCIDGTIHADLVPLINTLYIKPIEFNTKRYNEFFTYIYPKIKELVVIHNLEEFEKHNNCSVLETNCYLDINEGQLELKYEYFYEGLERDEAINKGIFPNTAMEENFIEQIQQFNFLKTTNKNEYVLETMDDALEFILSGIDTLKEIANVFVSDTIKNLRPIKTSGTPVGVRYSNNWLELIFNEEFYNVDELQQILDSLKKKKKYHLLKDGTILSLQERFFQEMEEIVESVGLTNKKIEKTNQIPVFKILQLEKFMDQKDMPKEAIKFLHDIRNYKTINYPIDKELAKVLRDYQKEGVRWLINLAYYRLSGILADDMGLGKSLEVISLLKSCRTKNPNLIVAPASLTYNWFNEFNKWAPNMKVSLVTGNGANREKLLSQIEPGQIIITSYDYLKRDLDIYKKMGFHFLIIDEAQAIKNMQALKTKSVKKINAMHRLVLTGTPIENSVADLWSIFDFLMPNYLFNYDRFRSEIEKGVLMNDDEAYKRIIIKTKPFILRRKKKDVLKDLPDKIEETISISMSSDQRKLYDAYLMQVRKVLTMRDKTNKITVLSMLTRLRQLCISPSLVVEGNIESEKINYTLDMINNLINTDHKVLIFSQFVSALELIQRELVKNDIPYFIITGDTNSKKRVEMCDEFNKENSNEKVFLISLKAGGTGLNLIGADTVIHLDPWWNIAIEEQASDRAHRIGQQRKVTVFKLIMNNSIEEKVIDLQKNKKEIAERIISNDIDINSLSFEDYDYLLS